VISTNTKDELDGATVLHLSLGKRELKSSQHLLVDGRSGRTSKYSSWISRDHWPVMGIKIPSIRNRRAPLNFFNWIFINESVSKSFIFMEQVTKTTFEAGPHF